MLEIPPAGTLTGLVKRALPGVETVALRTPDDLDAAWDLVDRHGVEEPAGDTPHLAPARRPGEGHVPPARRPRRRRRCSRRGHASARSSPCATSSRVAAPHGGIVVEWLVEDGDPVAPGQPLLRLHPEAGFEEEMSA